MAIRKDIFQQIGGFKSIYDADGMGFRYETDLCLRAKEYGRVVIDPKVRIWHKVAPRSRGFDRGKGGRYMYLANRNHTYFMLTFFWSKKQFIWMCFDLLIGSYRTPGIVYLLRRGIFDFSILKAVLYGKLSGLKMFKESV